MSPEQPPPAFWRAAQNRRLLRLGPIVIVAALWLAGWQIAAISLFVAAFCAITYVTLCPSTRLLGPLMCCLPEGHQGVLITLDDGPHPDTTPALLDILDRHGTKAVFFVIGSSAARWPDLVREMVRRGHVVGNHSQTHPSASYWALGAAGTWRETAACQITLEDLLGHAPVWFRAPVGHFNMFTHPALQCLGLKLMAWSARGFDTVDSQVSRVVGRMAPRFKHGAIVVLHEALPHSAAVLEATLTAIENTGLPFADPAALG